MSVVPFRLEAREVPNRLLHETSCCAPVILQIAKKGKKETLRNGSRGRREEEQVKGKGERKGEGEEKRIGRVRGGRESERERWRRKRGLVGKREQENGEKRERDVPDLGPLEERKHS